MANRQKGEVGFKALGKSWTMKLGVNAMCEIEDATGRTISEVGKLLSSQETATIKLMRAVMWGALQEHHEGLDIKEVGLIIDDIGMAEAGRLVGDSFTAASPEAKGGEGRPRKATAE